MATVLERWGHVDVLVNNGRYVGPGHMDRVVDTPMELYERHLAANALAPLVLIKQVLPSMVARGGGTIINVSSGAGISDPPAPAGNGGWGLGYGLSKGAAYRIAGILALELGDQGIRAYNLEPGFVATERIAQDMRRFGFDAASGIPTDVPGAVTAWLVTDPAAAEPNGRTVHAPQVCEELGLVPGWPSTRYPTGTTSGQRRWSRSWVWGSSAAASPTVTAAGWSWGSGCRRAAARC